ncbi:MAG: hypothetical protein IPL83_15935 [Bdellovibrionales bacterium]|nr:hypothetical protein [Bdellovibrionales bacterium]
MKLSLTNSGERGNDFYNNFYFAEESLVKEARKFMVWTDAPVGLRKGLPEDRTLGIGGKFSVGFIYGELKRPEDFTGATASISKTFLLPELNSNECQKLDSFYISPTVCSRESRLGMAGKTGVLYWGRSSLPLFPHRP